MSDEDIQKILYELTEEEREDMTVDNHCPVCGEYESECECVED